MSLPKLDLPKYTHHLVGIDKKITYRPFTVKEQKILLHAKQSEEPNDQVNAIKQIIEMCTYEDINVDELPFFDIEDLFLRIRTKSVSEVSEIMYKVRDSDEKVKVKINLDDVKVQKKDGHDKKIMLTDTIGVMMKYPSLELLSKPDLQNEDLITQSIDYVFTSEEVFYFKDFTGQEVEDWVEQFDVTVLKKIYEFFDTMPRIRHSVDVTLRDGSKETIKFEGLQDLFT